MLSPDRARSLVSSLGPVCALGALLAGCGSTLPPPPPQTPVSAPPAPPPDVTAVPEPVNLVFYGRVSNLTASMKVAVDWARLPTLDPTMIIGGFIEGLTETKAYAPLAEVIDGSQPIDFAGSFVMKMPPEGYGAFSAAVKSFEAAKSQLAEKYDLHPGDGGVVVINLRDDGAKMSSEKSSGGDTAASCELAPAAGAAPYRLVCATSRSGLKALGPYLTRTTPRKTITPDVHVELHAKPIGGFATLGRMQGTSLLTSILGLDPGATPASLELVTAAIGDIFDYVGDLDTLTADATLDPAHATLAYRTTFRSSTSVLAQVATAHPERADVPPEVFWRVPGDSDFASFFAPVDDAVLTHPRDLVGAALLEQMKRKKVPAADARLFADFVKEIFRGSRGMLAHGGAEQGYWLVERDDPAEVTEKIIKDLVVAWNRPAIVKWLKADSKEPVALPTLTVRPPPKGLPKGSLHVELLIPPSPPPPPPSPAHGGTHPPPAKAPLVAAKSKEPPKVWHIVVVPDGARSWVALSGYDTAARDALVAVTAAPPKPDNLGARASARGLDGFKEARMTTGGFFTVRALVDAARDLSSVRPGATAAWDRVTGGLPAKGVTPVVFTATAGAPTSDAPGGVHEIRMDIPADAIRDGLFVALQTDQLK